MALGSGGIAAAEDLSPEQARAFVVNKLFDYTCFDGTTGMVRIYSDGSVVGTIRSGQGETRFTALPEGTIRIDERSMCAHLAGSPLPTCFQVEKLDYRSFRGAIPAAMSGISDRPPLPAALVDRGDGSRPRFYSPSIRRLTDIIIPPGH
jgi:hypothetical protein